MFVDFQATAGLGVQAGPGLHTRQSAADEQSGADFAALLEDAAVDSGAATPPFDLPGVVHQELTEWMLAVPVDNWGASEPGAGLEVETSSSTVLDHEPLDPETDGATGASMTPLGTLEVQRGQAPDRPDHEILTVRPAMADLGNVLQSSHSHPSQVTTQPASADAVEAHVSAAGSTPPTPAAVTEWPAESMAGRSAPEASASDDLDAPTEPSERPAPSALKQPARPTTPSREGASRSSDQSEPVDPDGAVAKLDDPGVPKAPVSRLEDSGRESSTSRGVEHGPQERPPDPAVRASRPAASQLARALERVMGEATSDAAHPVQPDAQGAFQGGGSAFQASSEGHGAPAASGGRTTQAPGAAPFVLQSVAELQRAVAAPASQPPSTAPRDVPDPDTVDRLVQSMRVQFRQGIGDAVVRLRPEHLGEVSISLRVEQQSVSATVRAELPSVRQWLEAQESLLRSGLSQQGLTLDRFVVREDESRRQDEPPPDEPQHRRQRQARARSDEAEPRFEVVV